MTEAMIINQCNCPQWQHYKKSIIKWYNSYALSKHMTDLVQAWKMFCCLSSVCLSLLIKKSLNQNLHSGAEVMTSLNFKEIITWLLLCKYPPASRIIHNPDDFAIRSSLVLCLLSLKKKLKIMKLKHETTEAKRSFLICSFHSATLETTMTCDFWSLSSHDWCGNYGDSGGQLWWRDE